MCEQKTENNWFAVVYYYYPYLTHFIILFMLLLGHLACFQDDVNMHTGLAETHATNIV